MNEQNLYQAIGGVGEDLIEMTATYKRKKKPIILFRTVIAACLSLVILGGCFGGYRVAVEAAEYREAVAFFEENGLSSYGLSKKEMKSVYRDITTKTFSYAKTAEVLNTLSVEMYFCDLAAVDSDSLESFWHNHQYNKNSNANNFKPVEEKNGVWYEIDRKVYDQPYTVACYDGEKLLWEYTLEDRSFMHHGYIECDEGIIVYGGFGNWVYTVELAHTFMLDHSGRLLWSYTSEDVGSDFTTAVKSGEEIAFFGEEMNFKKDQWEINTTFTLLNTDGVLLHTNKTAQTEYFSYMAAVKLKDCYLLKTYDSRLFYFSLEGEPIEKKEYFDGELKYNIQDLVYHNGQVWMSAQKPSGTVWNEATKKEIQEFLDAISKFPEEEQRRARAEFQRSFYEADLFICDENGEIRKGYTASEYHTASLEIGENGNIIWHLLRVDEIYPTKPEQSTTMKMTVVTEFELEFAEDGRLVRKTEMGSYKKQMCV